MIKLLVGFLGCGAMATIAYYVQTLFGKGPAEVVLQQVKDRMSVKTGVAAGGQDVIAKQLKVAEQASDASQKKIKVIVEKASVDIHKVLKKDSLVEIVNDIDDLWPGI